MESVNMQDLADKFSGNFSAKTWTGGNVERIYVKQYGKDIGYVCYEEVQDALEASNATGFGKNLKKGKLEVFNILRK